MFVSRFLLLLLLLPVSLTSRAADAPAFSVHFGIIAIDTASGAKVVQETRSIPFKDCKTGAAYGYSVRDKEGRRFSTHAVFYPPSPVKKVDEGLWGNAETSPTTGLTTDSSSFAGSGVAEFCFTESDPPGEWTVVIFVNGIRFEKVKFRTIE